VCKRYSKWKKKVKQFEWFILLKNPPCICICGLKPLEHLIRSFSMYHESVRETLVGFSWNLMLENFTEACRDMSVFI
jgi:hypothetical protein